MQDKLTADMAVRLRQGSVLDAWVGRCYPFLVPAWVKESRKPGGRAVSVQTYPTYEDCYMDCRMNTESGWSVEVPVPDIHFSGSWRDAGVLVEYLERSGWSVELKTGVNLNTSEKWLAEAGVYEPFVKGNEAGVNVLHGPFKAWGKQMPEAACRLALLIALADTDQSQSLAA